jgi:hypothetical protein
MGVVVAVCWTVSSRIPAFHIHPSARPLFWTAIVATVIWVFEGTYEGWVAWASATVTAYAAGLVILKLDGLRVADFPRYVRWWLYGFGIFSGWFIVGHIYQTRLDLGFGEAFHDFALLVAIPYVQGVLVGFFLWGGIREARGVSKRGHGLASPE